MIHIYAIHHLKNGPLYDLASLYKKRLGSTVSIDTFEIKKTNSDTERKEKESGLILNHIKPRDVLIACDERGQNITTIELGTMIQNFRARGPARIVFAIGGAGGHDNALRARADALIAFGAATWPHLFVRIMLLEQLYRIQQIEAGHPYHRA